MLVSIWGVDVFWGGEMPRSSIFISYSHHDVSWKDKLLTHLSALQDPGIDAWDDSRIPAGADWRSEINYALESARIAVLMVSADFLASAFIRDHEVPRLLQRHSLQGLRVYPLIVRECPWRRVAWLGRLQARPLYADALAGLSDHHVDSVLSKVAQEIQDFLAIDSLPDLPPLEAIIPTTSRYTPPLPIGLRLYPSEPLKLDFVIAPGDECLDLEGLTTVANEIIEYFLTCLTVPEDHLWVNLSPEEPDNVIPDDLAATKMGHVLLQQDYIIKQISASLMFPEYDIGKQFWHAMYSTVNNFRETSINTFNKIWVVPNVARVWERSGLCLITDQKLRAMVDEDYRSLKAGLNSKEYGTAEIPEQRVKDISSLATEQARRALLPEMEREVNTGLSFAPLRQIYHALILARWYKEVMARTPLKDAYVDKGKLLGLTATDCAYKEKIYKQYLEALSRGVFKFIHEDYDHGAQVLIPRKYYSGGILAKVIGDCLDRQTESTREQAQKVLASEAVCYIVRVSLKPFKEDEDPSALKDENVGTVGGIDLAAALNLTYERGSEETKMDISAVDKLLHTSIWGLTAQIDEIQRIENADQLIGGIP